MRLISRTDQALTKLGVLITTCVGTMWTAIIFGIVAIAATPGVLPAQLTLMAQWTAQDFLQLVLLPVIMVGQAVGQAVIDALIREMRDDIKAELAVIQEATADLKLIANALHVHLTGESHPAAEE